MIALSDNWHEKTLFNRYLFSSIIISIIFILSLIIYGSVKYLPEIFNFNLLYIPVKYYIIISIISIIFIFLLIIRGAHTIRNYYIIESI